MQDILWALHVLKEGKCLIFPTDTVYGIGCDASNEQAVQDLFELTERPVHKGMIVLCDSLRMIEQYAEIRFDLEKRMIENCMPGPLTIILDSKHELSPILEQANGTIGMRIPDHDIALDLITSFWSPLATKSANISGLIPPTSVDEIDDYFVEQGIMIVNGGVCDIQIPSTIVRVTDEDDFQIVRQGSMTEDEIRELVD